MGTSVRDEILGFIQGLSYWQKYLSAFLIGTLTNSSRKEVITQAAQYFLSENDLLEEPLEEMELSIPAAINSEQKTNHRTGKLVSVSNLKNIAAVRENQVLQINKTGITAIFGVTGVGKSSYARVMNDAFISRGDVNVIGNIFDPDRSGKPEAIFTFNNDNGKEYSLKYPEETNSAEFRQYATFDSKAVRVHIDSNNELHVTPKGFDFFENLASLVSETNQYIQNLINNKQKENIFPRHFPEDSEIKNSITNLSQDSDLEPIKEMGSFDEKDEKLLQEKEKELARLKIDDPAKKKKLNQDIINEIEELKKYIEKMSSTFSQENIEKAKKRIERRKELLAEVKNSGIQKFNDSNFKGIGSETWKKFISAGKDFLELQEQSWNEGASCPYCRQDLTLAASKLIKNYETYLKSESERELKNSDEEIAKLIHSFKSLEILNQNSKDKASRWLSEEKDKSVVNERIKEILSHYSQVKETLVNNLENRSWSDLDCKNFEIDWEALYATLKKESDSLNFEEIEREKKKLNIRIISLKHKKILKKLLPEIEKFISNMSWLEKCKTAQNKIRTHQITSFSKKLYEDHVTNLYREKFKKECLELNVRNHPELRQRGEIGKTKRSYTIGNNTKPSNILSEGEQRAVALADFFTEIKISKIDGGLIFDDPVASQDHERKELIAQKLVQEASSRQIIVFTHDLAFYSDLTNAANDKNIPIKYHWINSLGINDSGIIHSNCKRDFERDYIEPNIAKNALDKAKNTENPKEIHKHLKDGFDALRTTYEAFFTSKILNHVITRFDRKIKYSEIDQIYAPRKYLNKISKKLEYLSKNISAHLQADMDNLVITCEMLAQEVNEYKKMYDEYIREKKHEKKSSGIKSDSNAPSINK